jgi:phenylalanyl-tRNA synthetase alpha chain
MRQTIKAALEQKEKEILKTLQQEIEERSYIDVTVPGKKVHKGHLHPLTLAQDRAIEIFHGMGFSVIQGPEIEDEWHNFDALNIPEHHPARDMWDTFWLKETGGKMASALYPEGKKLLLRTQTSSVQIRYLERNQPPARIIVPGRVFRHEATDASHEINFYQLEGLMVDKDISFAHLKAIMQEFLSQFFERKAIIRIRPSYFPFTEPSVEIDIQGKNGEWLECVGAGMVHPAVLKSAGLNPKFLQGFAFGIGIDRLTMLKYGIEDVRSFYENDVRFLRQF